MALFPKQDGRRRTQLGGKTRCYGDEIWYANITPDIDVIKFLEPQQTVNPLVSAEQRVAEFERRMNYKAQPLSDDAQDRLDTKFHYSHQMRRWVE